MVTEKIPNYKINRRIGETSPDSTVRLTCNRCGKEFFRPRWYQIRSEKRNKGRGDFCTRRCALISRNQKPESIQKISEKQKLVSVMSRGRLGHTVSDAVKEKIRKAKLGVPSKTDWDIVLRELEERNIQNAAVMRSPIPDAVFIQDGKLVALEVEKERWEVGVRAKMTQYKDISHFDKVILVWYTPDGTRQKEWVLENGEWTLTA